jgi:hypothetical protein
LSTTKVFDWCGQRIQADTANVALTWTMPGFVQFVKDALAQAPVLSCVCTLVFLIICTTATNVHTDVWFVRQKDRKQHASVPFPSADHF